MYKRPKRSFNGNLIIGRTACASTGNRENIVDEPNKSSSQLNGNPSQIQTTQKELTQQVPASVPVPLAFKEPTNNENFVEIFSSCGMDIETDTCHVLS